MKLFLIIFLFVASCAFTTPKASPQQFTDVSPDHPFYLFVEDVAARGIMLGYGGGRFGVDDPLPRYQAAIVIERALDVFMPPQTNSQTFLDVDGSDYYKDFVEDLVARGITTGCSQSPPLFCPYEATTRGAAAAFILRAKGEFNPLSPYPGTFRFLDVPESHPFYAFIHRLKSLGVTNGCAAFFYCPDVAITRGQMAVFISRAFPQ